jgi:5-amino-6-(5-phosphoribosylamino)uracil reductase
MPLHRIHPDDVEIDPAEAITGMGWADLAPADRPYLALNMVTTADGRAAVEGRTRAISSDTDRAIFHNLRTQADAIMAGAGTIRSERYGALIKTDELREKRVREGLEPNPLAIVVSGRLHLPEDVGLLQDPESRVVILTQSDGELSGVQAQVEYLRADPGPWDPRPQFEALRKQYGVRSILCEGGPTLNSSLLPYGLVDELFLTVAPLLAGGPEEMTILGASPEPALTPLELIWSLEDRGELFLRYRLQSA